MAVFNPQPGDRILVIDDRRTFGAFEAEYARTSKEGASKLKQMLKEGPIDIVIWDHDLGIVDNIDDNPRELVDMLAEMAYAGNPVKVGLMAVVSSNPNGADRIMNALKNFYPTVRIVATDWDVSFQEV